MFSKLKSLLQDRCPDCDKKLVSRHDHLALTKHCPDYHYTEETYSQLGVTIVYKSGQPESWSQEHT